MYYDRKRRVGALRPLGVIAILISTMTMVGCEAMRPFNKTILDGFGTAGKATVGGLETAGRATVGGLQWVADGGETGIIGRSHGATDQPLLLVTGMRFPGIKLSDLSVLSIKAVDANGEPLPWKQGQLGKSKWGPALTITIEPQAATQRVDVSGVLIYHNARWRLTARSVELPRAADGSTDRLWRTELITVTRQ